MSQKNQQVNSVTDAINVLIQGVEIGRAKGIYSWEDLELISQSLKLLVNQKAEVSEKSENLEVVKEQTKG
jgi:hypothetical protein